MYHSFHSLTSKNSAGALVYKLSTGCLWVEFLDLIQSKNDVSCFLHLQHLFTAPSSYDLQMACADFILVVKSFII